MNWTETEIQALKAQDAKDLAVQLLHELQAMERAPITAGQVQLKELQYGLQIKQAEAEDARQREAHEQRLKELELQIEQEKSKQAEAVQNADRVRHEHARLVEQVQVAEEALSVHLETATREHHVRMEALETDYAQRLQSLEAERDRLEHEKAGLVETIQELTELSDVAQDVEQLRKEIESRKASQQRELERLDESYEMVEFEKNKKVNQLKRDQEMAIAELEMEHKKRVLQLDKKAAEKILAGVAMLAVSKTEWEDLQNRLREKSDCDESAMAAIREQAAAEFRKTYNITTADVLDVTELYYRHQALDKETSSQRDQISKLETEIARMRQHIEREPERLASAVEAAKVHVENTIEQAGKR